jgi:hypothetical protein
MHLVAGGGDPSEDAQVELGLDWEHGGATPSWPNC